jgi:hypothetical protein
MAGTNYNVDTTINESIVAESPTEVRLNVTVEIDTSGTLTVRSLTLATLASEVEIYSP